MELVVVYEGGKTRFDHVSGGAWSIRYLRDDCEYHLKDWNHSFGEFSKETNERIVIFEQTFRTVDRKLDPSAPGGVPEEPTQKSKQAAPSKAAMPSN